jgi:Skp family chaperone for outer membrane proteins
VRLSHLGTKQLVAVAGLLDRLTSALTQERTAIGLYDLQELLRIADQKEAVSLQISAIVDADAGDSERADADMQTKVQELARKVHVAARVNLALLLDAQASIRSILGNSGETATYDRRARSVTRAAPLIAGAV